MNPPSRPSPPRVQPLRPHRLRPASFLATLALVSTLVAPLRAAVIEVPADHPTIQSAVDAALEGDIVQLAAGTFLENVDLGTKAITLRGAGAGSTTIDGSGATDGPNLGSVLRCAPGTTPATRIEDLRLTGGTGVVTDSFLGPQKPLGGGIFCLDGSPSLARVRIDGCSAQAGAGAFIVGPGDGSIVGCTIEANTSVGAAGGLYVIASASLLVEDCVVRDNIAAGNVGVGNAGGARLYGFEATIRDCLFDGNQCPGSGGALYLANFSTIAPGPGTLLLEGCTFRGNSASTGAALVNLFGAGTMRDCVVTECTGGRPVSHGTGSFQIQRSTFSENSAINSFFGVATGSQGMAIEHCTIANLTADFLVSSPTGTVTLRNSIVRDAFAVGLTAFDAMTVAYSNIEGGFGGPGNIDVDPEFLDAPNGDFRLAPSSASIDAGDPASPLDPDGTTADQGAFPVFQGAFRRGDTNADGAVDVADPLRLFGEFFFDELPVACRSAADANDDELVNLADPIYLLNFLFQGGPPVPAPTECGTDPTPGILCESLETGC